MTAPLSADRIKELREWLIRGKDALEDMPYRGLKATEYTDLLSILSDYSSLRAENERLWTENKALSSAVRYGWKAHAKVEAEVKHRCDQRDAALESCSLVSAENERLREQLRLANIDNFNAEAELAKQGPLIQAVMGLDEIDFIADDWPSEKLRESADKLRSEK